MCPFGFLDLSQNRLKSSNDWKLRSQYASPAAVRTTRRAVVPDVLALAKEVPSLGNISLATTICGNELVYYGIHALEMTYAVLGGGAVSCLNVGQSGRIIVPVRFANGRGLVFMVAEKEWMRAGYQLNLYGAKGWRSLTPNLADLYWYLFDQFLAFVLTKKEVFPIEEEVGVIEAGKRSLAEKREVAIAEVMQGSGQGESTR